MSYVEVTLTENLYTLTEFITEFDTKLTASSGFTISIANNKNYLLITSSSNLLFKRYNDHRDKIWEFLGLSEDNSIFTT